jgi:hypothetical protein
MWAAFPRRGDRCPVTYVRIGHAGLRNSLRARALDWRSMEQHLPKIYLAFRDAHPEVAGWWDRRPGPRGPTCAGAGAPELRHRTSVESPRRPRQKRQILTGNSWVRFREASAVPVRHVRIGFVCHEAPDHGLELSCSGVGRCPAASRVAVDRTERTALCGRPLSVIRETRGPTGARRRRRRRGLPSRC